MRDAPSFLYVQTLANLLDDEYPQPASDNVMLNEWHIGNSGMPIRR